MKKITIQVSDQLYKQISIAARVLGRTRPAYLKLGIEIFTKEFVEKFEARIKEMGNSK